MDDYTSSAIAPPDFGGVALALEQTKPWVRLLSVLGFVVVGLMALVGLFGGLAAVTSGEPSMAILMVVYPLSALLYFFPALFLWRYADRIQDFLSSRTLEGLQTALEAQRSFWKFTGIMVVVSFVLGIVAVMFIGAIAAAFGARSI